LIIAGSRGRSRYSGRPDAIIFMEWPTTASPDTVDIGTKAAVTMRETNGVDSVFGLRESSI
jgi:hypothetical protein